MTSYGLRSADTVRRVGASPAKHFGLFKSLQQARQDSEGGGGFVETWIVFVFLLVIASALFLRKVAIQRLLRRLAHVESSEAGRYPSISL
jgi:hypothetical protein